MSTESSFRDYLENDLRQAREQEAAEAFERRHQIERDDREFVRAALQDAVPEDEIERGLVFRSEFVRLNPDRDSHAYARGLIDEEKSSFYALSAPVPPSLGETVPQQSQQPNPTSQASTNGAGAPNSYLQTPRPGPSRNGGRRSTKIRLTIDDSHECTS